MNQHVIQPTAEPAGTLADMERAKERHAFSSLALQLRRNGHQERQWSREASAKGQIMAAAGFTARANRYAADALWYWRRSRRT